MTRGLDVLFVVPSLEPGGAERVVVNLANGLVALGARPAVLATDRPGALAGQLADGVSVTALGRSRVRSAVPAIVRTVRRQAPDVVVTTHTHLNILLCAARRLLPSSTALVIREPTHAPVAMAGRSTRRTRQAQQRLYRRSDLLVASSEELAADLSALTGARVLRMENPVDVDRVRATASSGTGVDRATAPSDRGRLVVAVGRLSRQKSMDELIAAFADGSGPDDRLEILGDGPEKESLRALAGELGLGQRVVLAGLRDDHWRRVAEADVLVLASRAEGMPNAVLEALALGTPVIATTDLTVLTELAREVGPSALRLVAREGLAEALGTLPRRDGPYPAPSLLPDRFTIGAVATALHRTLVSPDA